MTKIYLSPGFWRTLYYRKVFCKRFSRKCVCGADLVGKVASCISNVDSLCGHLLISLLQNLIVSWQKYLDHSGTAQKEFMTKIVHIQVLKIDIYVLPFNFKLQLHLFQFMTWAHICFYNATTQMNFQCYVLSRVCTHGYHLHQLWQEYNHQLTLSIM